MKKEQTKESASFCYKSCIVKWVIFVLPVLTMLGAMLYMQYIIYSDIQHSFDVAERGAKSHASSEELKAASDKIFAKTQEVAALVSAIKEDVSKATRIDDEKQKMISNKYHVALLASIMEKKIIDGDDISEDLAMLKKFANNKFAKEETILSAYKPISNQAIPPEYLDEKKYPYGPPSHIMRGAIDNPDAKTQIDKIIVLLNDAVLEKQQINEEDTGIIAKLKAFFANWFSIEKVDQKSEFKDVNSQVSLAITFMKDNNIDAAHYILSKVSKNKDIAAVFAKIKMLNDALNACRSIREKMLLDA